MHYTFRTIGTCAQVIEFDINGNVITNIKFLGGCPGNLKAISKILDGWTVEAIEEKLSNKQNILLEKQDMVFQRPNRYCFTYQELNFYKSIFPNLILL